MHRRPPQVHDLGARQRHLTDAEPCDRAEPDAHGHRHLDRAPEIGELDGAVQIRRRPPAEGRRLGEQEADAGDAHEHRIRHAGVDVDPAVQTSPRAAAQLGRTEHASSDDVDLAEDPPTEDFGTTSGRHPGSLPKIGDAALASSTGRTFGEGAA